MAEHVDSLAILPAIASCLRELRAVLDLPGDDPRRVAAVREKERLVRIAEARLERAGDRCACGAVLARYSGAGASGLLCASCDGEHAAELERED